MNSDTTLPFLKWAGGKRWLCDNYDNLLCVKHKRYIEPFLGSGAIFFKLKPSSAILSDINRDLIETYKAIRDDWRSVYRLMQRHHLNHNKDYYYKIRSQNLRSPISKAAQFIYLNRTCWNGLYRVNLKGQFNVPIGTKKTVILNSDDFENTARMLSTVVLKTCDFQETMSYATKGDFVFVDPPYTVKHNHNGFIKYNEGLFSWEDQIRLRDSVVNAYNRGAKLLITNAYHDCIKEIYEGIGKHIRLNRPSVISGKSDTRGRFDEMVIKCF
jgi:DNA adenine methylase